MLKRLIIEKLKAWHRQELRKSLIISGARQIGKTFIVRAFAQEKYEAFIELNFLEQPELKGIFSGNLDVSTLLLNMSVFRNLEQTVPGKTLILLDEVQECPEAITSLKFWSMDSRYDVISTGSALGMSHNKISSYPVGYVEYLDMHSLNFQEFLWANHISDAVIDTLRACFKNRTPVPYVLHQKMMDLLRYYMILGGMPEVINAFLDQNDILAADSVQKRIYRDYIADIAHLAPPLIKIKAEKCYRSIPLQLSGENHKFKYGTVESKGTSSKFETSIDWLKNAYIVKPAYNLKNIAYPPELYKDDSNFRLYPTDIGMLMASCDFSIKKALLEEKTMEDAPSNIVLGTAKGGLFEGLAADILIKNGYD